jgi:hypothetical protein
VRDNPNPAALLDKIGRDIAYATSSEKK